MKAKQENKIKHMPYSDQAILSSKEEALVSFKNAHDLVAEMINMVESEKTSIDIMQKNLSVVAFLRCGQRMLMENNLGGCFKRAQTAKSPVKNKKIRREILKVIKMFHK
ncbi:MAG: metal-sensing transcriptional repressor [bacterium]|nr:metal-sensing transcriptional repressor [bacterium]